MNPVVAGEIWTWLGPLAQAVRADRYLRPLFDALAAGDRRALHGGRAAHDLARCSRVTLAARCNAHFGMGYAHLVMAFRLDQAHRLLQEEPLPVAGAARVTGFLDVTVFRHAYKRRFGFPPGEATRASGGTAGGPDRRATSGPGVAARGVDRGDLSTSH